MANAIFRPGQWVVLNDVVGLLYKRKDKRVDGDGKLIEAGPNDEFEFVDVGTPEGASNLKRIAVDSQVDFHPVIENGTTNHSAIVTNAIDAGGAPLVSGLRVAKLVEIPSVRRPSDEVAAKFGYE